MKKIINRQIIFLVASFIFSIASIILTLWRLDNFTTGVNSVFALAIDIIAICSITVFIGGCVLDRAGRNDRNAEFSVFLFTAVRSLLYDLMTYIVLQIDTPVANLFHNLFKALYILSVISLIISFVAYLQAIFPAMEKKARNYIRILRLYQLALLILLIFNIEHKIVFVIKDGIYTRELFAPITFAVAVILTLGIIPLYRNEKTDMSERYAILVYISLPSICALLSGITNGVPFSSIATFLSACVLYVHSHVRQNWMIQNQRAEMQKQKTAIMLSQIQPHFLYNSLSSIAALCGTNPQKAKKTTVLFTKYLRGNIDSLSAKDNIPFENELNHTKAYLEIECIRFPKRLNIEYDITVSDFDIPSLTLQPLVENAVKYGVCKKEDGGTVKIETQELDDKIKISVSDDGVGFDITKVDFDSGNHIGINNVSKRLETMANGYLEIKSEIGKGTRAVIVLPKKQSFNSY